MTGSPQNPGRWELTGVEISTVLRWPFQTTYNTAVQSESLTSTIYPSATRGGTGVRGSQHPLR